MRQFSIKNNHAAELLDKITTLTGQNETEAVIRALELYQKSLLINYPEAKNGREGVNGMEGRGADANAQASLLLEYLNELATKPASSRTRAEVDAQILAERDAWDE